MSKEYRSFDKAMQRLIKVTHDEVKAKLQEEKAAKKRKKAAKVKHDDH
jgi:hypothetical protein